MQVEERGKRKYVCNVMCVGLTQYECEQQSSADTHTHGQRDLKETYVAALGFNPAAAKTLPLHSYLLQYITHTCTHKKHTHTLQNRSNFAGKLTRKQQNLVPPLKKSNLHAKLNPKKMKS